MEQKHEKKTFAYHQTTRATKRFHRFSRQNRSWFFRRKSWICSSCGSLRKSIGNNLCTPILIPKRKGLKYRQTEVEKSKKKSARPISDPFSHPKFQIAIFTGAVKRTSKIFQQIKVFPFLLSRQVLEVECHLRQVSISQQETRWFGSKIPLSNDMMYKAQKQNIIEILAICICWDLISMPLRTSVYLLLWSSLQSSAHLFETHPDHLELCILSVVETPNKILL